MKRFLITLALLLVAVPCSASRDLKEDTAVTIVVGPFVDSAGAAVTGPTIASIDITAYKNDGTAVTITPAASGSSNDMVHVDDGFYSLEITTTDSSTPGYLRLTFQIAGSLIFMEDFNILPANIYDSKYSSDKLEVDLVLVDGAATSSELLDAAGVADAVWDAAIASHNDADSFGEFVQDITAGEVATAVWAAGTRTITGGTIGTYTGNTPQTGDGYAILNSGSFGLAIIEAQTDDIGVAGLGLSAVPWNALWDTEAQSEAADALNAYDPPTKAEMDTGFSTTLQENVEYFDTTANGDIGRTLNTTDPTPGTDPTAAP